MARTQPVLMVTVIPKGSTAKRLDLTDQVLSFEYEDAESKADMLRLTVDNYDLRNFDDPIWRKGNIVEATWGYADALAPVRRCRIQKVTGFQELKIEAHGMEVALNTVVKSRSFENMTRAEVIREIARSAGFRSPEVLHVENTKVRYPHIHQGRLTDAQFIRRLAHKEGYEWYIDFDGFHFHRRQVTQQPRRVFEWRTPTGNNPLEILSISIENDITARPGKVTAVSHDPMKRRGLSTKADNDTDTDRGVLASTLEISGGEGLMSIQPEEKLISEETVFTSEQPPVLSSPPPDEVLSSEQPVMPQSNEILSSPPPEQVLSSEQPEVLASMPELVMSYDERMVAAEEILWSVPQEETLMCAESSEQAAQRLASAKFRKTQQVAVKMTMEIVGDPNLLAKSVVEVRGVGKRLSQLYYIRTVKHTIQEGYKCKIEMVSDGSGGHSTKSHLIKEASAIQVGGGTKAKGKHGPPAPRDGLTTAADLAAKARVEAKKSDEEGQLMSYEDQRGRDTPQFSSVEDDDESESSSSSDGGYSGGGGDEGGGDDGGGSEGGGSEGGGDDGSPSGGDEEGGDGGSSGDDEGGSDE